MAVAYYPVQNVNFGVDIKGVQSVGIDFDAKKTEFYQFGSSKRIGYATLESPSVNAKIQYVVNQNESNSSLYSDFLSQNSNYRPCELKFPQGKMTIASGEIVGYSLKGQVGSLITTEIDILGLNATFSSSTSMSPGSSRNAGVVSPINLSLGVNPLKSFNINITIPKKIVYSVGNGPEIVNFGKPKLFAEYEFILGELQSLPAGGISSISADPGGTIFSYNSSDKILRHSTQNSVTDVGTIRVIYEAEINDQNEITISY